MRSRAALLAIVPIALATAACGGPAAPSGSSASPSVAPSSPALPSEAPVPDAAAAWILYQRPDYETEDGRNGALMRLRPGTDDAVPALPERFGGRAVDGYDWSPDGTGFAFAAWDPPSAPYDPTSTLDLWVANWDGANATRVFDCAPPCWLAGGPAWSPDGRQIGFSRTDAVDGVITTSSLQVLDLATGEIETILEATAPDVIGGADWAPDGRRLLVGRARLRSTRIADLVGSGTIYAETGLAVLDLGTPGASPRPLPGPDIPIGSAAWHPVDDLIVFDAGRFDNADPARSTTELYLVRADGTGLAKLTDAESVGALLFGPTWSPDGSAILCALWHRASYTPTLASVMPDGGAFEELGGDARVVGLYPRQRPIAPAP